MTHSPSKRNLGCPTRSPYLGDPDRSMRILMENDNRSGERDPKRVVARQRGAGRETRTRRARRLAATSGRRQEL